MNTRIQELAVKSGFELEDGGHLMLHHLYVTNRLEKFAELLVQECIGLCMNVNGDLPRTEPLVAASIKKHFGVE